MLVEADHQAMTTLAQLAERGKVRPIVVDTYPLLDIEAVRAAHRAGETGRVAGKLVLSAAAGIS
jgi:NADPH:quinone reductase-like Zn-dependent oxidoreductase